VVYLEDGITRGDPSNTLNHVSTNFSISNSPTMMILSDLECWESPLFIYGTISV